jgi:glycosyltransferase involved in cell wall biosynthesis
MAKVVVIGPMPPFRSGVARHTHALASALAARADVEVSGISFSRQYPSFLFPGEDDRDPGGARPADYAVEYMIDTMNPLTWRAAAKTVSAMSPDIMITPAWTFFTAPCLGFVANRASRIGAEVVTIVHNAADHEEAWWKTKLSHYQLQSADRFVTHNNALAQTLRDFGLSASVDIFPHPVYDDYPCPEKTLPREFGLELLFFGLVRPYKGLDIALRALARSGRKDARLTIAGEFWDGRKETEALITELSLEDQVEIRPRYISDQETAELFARCDAVVTPYRTATGSGVVALAQHYRRPVIASAAPGLAEAVAHGRTGWIFPVGDVDALAGLLRRDVTRQSAAEMTPALDDVCERLSWSRFADAVLNGSS